MTGYRNVLTLLLFCLLPFCAEAQTNGCNSSYSRFGLGLQEDQTQGFNRSMGGVSAGLRIGNRVNMLNPASYAAIDSLSLIMDAGMRVSFSRMTLGNSHANATNCSLSNVNVGFHVARGLGMSIGFVPYTSIGYNFESPAKEVATGLNSGQSITTNNTYYGSGGLHQAYIGAGYNIWHGLSLGANVSFVWGSYSHLISPAYSEGGQTSSSYSGTYKLASANLKSYKLDLGIQYPVRLSQKDRLTIGATAGIGHRINQDVTLLHYTTAGDTTTYVAEHPFEIPYSFGGGAAWEHGNSWLVAADFHTEMWGKTSMPVEKENGVYEATEGYMKNSTRIAVGAQYTPDPYDKHFLKRVQYRAGVSYRTPSVIVNGITGPRELKVTLGAGIPITNSINNRSCVNVGLEWLRRTPASAQLLNENYLLINLGVTFNERWFMKFKIN